MLTAVVIIVVGVFGVYVATEHHSHAENILENAGAENSALETTDRFSTLIPYFVLFALVIVSILVIYGIFGGF